MKQDAVQIMGGGVWENGEGETIPHFWVFPEDAGAVQALIDFGQQFREMRFRYAWDAAIPTSPQHPAGVARLALHLQSGEQMIERAFYFNLPVCIVPLSYVLRDRKLWLYPHQPATAAEPRDIYEFTEPKQLEGLREAVEAYRRFGIERLAEEGEGGTSNETEASTTPSTKEQGVIEMQQQPTNDFLFLPDHEGDEAGQQFVAWAHIVAVRVGVVAEGSGYGRKERFRLRLITTAPTPDGGTYTITLWDDEARRVDKEVLRRAGDQP